MNKFDEFFDFINNTDTIKENLENVKKVKLDPVIKNIRPHPVVVEKDNENKINELKIPKNIIQQNNFENIEFEEIKIKNNILKSSISNYISELYNLEYIKINDELERVFKNNILYHIIIVNNIADIKKYKLDIIKIMLARFLYCEKAIEKNIAIIYTIHDNKLLSMKVKFEKMLYDMFRRRIT